ncbi:DUF4352 domain-containing protein [Clostridium sp. Marseille-P2415]|uniref:DUF4352 domain-containing protein n=1 Tax=Clostridium sp. Marseille-P2415 TaxID=1805471 RepID=UPI0009885FE5|nr:DUF4352 domain-containing protein [Clostridium sp. Marseille-P2415]
MKKKLLVPVLCAVALSATACGSNAAPEKAETTTTETTTAAETTTVDETTTAPETEAAPQTIPMGQAAKIGEWNVTVSNMQILDNIPDGYGSFSPDAGNKYLLVTMTVSNEGKQADSFLPSFSMGDDTSAKVIYGDGYEFTQTNLLGYSKSMTDSTINPLSSKEGDIAFEIPESVASATDPIILEISSGNEKINFALR